MNLVTLLAGLLLAFVSCAPIYAGMSIAPGTPAHTHSDASTGGGTLALSGTLSSTKACAAGYTRTTPNFCRRNAGVAPTALVRDACTTVAAPAADAIALRLRLHSKAISANVAATGRFTNVAAHTTSGCAGAVYSELVYAQGYEFSALVGIALALDTSFPVIATDSAGGSVFLKMTDDAGNAGASEYTIVGYFD